MEPRLNTIVEDEATDTYAGLQPTRESGEIFRERYSVRYESPPEGLDPQDDQEQPDMSDRTEYWGPSGGAPPRPASATLENRHPQSQGRRSRPSSAPTSIKTRSRSAWASGAGGGRASGAGGSGGVYAQTSSSRRRVPANIQAIMTQPVEQLAEEVVYLRRQVAGLQQDNKVVETHKRRLDAEVSKLQGMLLRRRVAGKGNGMEKVGGGAVQEDQALKHAIEARAAIRQLGEQKDKLAEELLELQRSTRATRVAELEAEKLAYMNEAVRLTKLSRALERRAAEATAASSKRSPRGGSPGGGSPGRGRGSGAPHGAQHVGHDMSAALRRLTALRYAQVADKEVLDRVVLAMGLSHTTYYKGRKGVRRAGQAAALEQEVRYLQAELQELRAELVDARRGGGSRREADEAAARAEVLEDECARLRGALQDLEDENARLIAASQRGRGGVAAPGAGGDVALDAARAATGRAQAEVQAAMEEAARARKDRDAAQRLLALEEGDTARLREEVRMLDLEIVTVRKQLRAAASSAGGLEAAAEPAAKAVKAQQQPEPSPAAPDAAPSSSAAAPAPPASVAAPTASAPPAAAAAVSPAPSPVKAAPAKPAWESQLKGVEDVQGRAPFLRLKEFVSRNAALMGDVYASMAPPSSAAAAAAAVSELRPADLEVLLLRVLPDATPRERGLFRAMVDPEFQGAVGVPGEAEAAFSASLEAIEVARGDKGAMAGAAGQPAVTVFGLREDIRALFESQWKACQAAFVSFVPERSLEGRASQQQVLGLMKSLKPLYTKPEVRLLLALLEHLTPPSNADGALDFAELTSLLECAPAAPATSSAAADRGGGAADAGAVEAGAGVAADAAPDSGAGVAVDAATEEPAGAAAAASAGGATDAAASTPADAPSADLPAAADPLASDPDGLVDDGLIDYDDGDLAPLDDDEYDLPPDQYM